MSETSQASQQTGVDNKLITDGKNSMTVSCERCGSIILLPALGHIENVEHLLPSMTVKAKQQGDEISVDKICDYWRVDNIFTFENIGFSNTVDNVKYLTCADCEIGPIGWHNISNEKSYVALARVLHK